MLFGLGLWKQLASDRRNRKGLVVAAQSCGTHRPPGVIEREGEGSAGVDGGGEFWHFWGGS
jgi:hypothetical protein